MKEYNKKFINIFLFQQKTIGCYHIMFIKILQITIFSKNYVYFIVHSSFL